MTINVRSAQFPVWTQLQPPSPDDPFWTEEDGTRHSFNAIAADLDPDTHKQVCELHADAIQRLVLSASKAARDGEHSTARRLAVAAGRLCQETTGLWPASALVTPNS